MAEFAIYRPKEQYRAFQFTQEMAEAYLFDNAPLPSPLYLGSADTMPPERLIYSSTFRAATSGEHDPRVKFGDWVLVPVDKAELLFGDPLVYCAEDFELSFEKVSDA